MSAGHIGTSGLEVSRWMAVDKWVQVFTEEDLTDANEEIRAVYQPNQYFLVISREDYTGEQCDCTLIDITGKIYSFTARFFEFVGVPLSEMREALKNDVETFHGKEKVQDVYIAADKHLVKGAKYYARFPAKTLQSANLTAEIVRIRKNEGKKEGNK